MTRYIRALYDGVRDGEPDAPLRFTASTEEVGRDGLIIRQDGWQLDSFKANPVVQWAHDYSKPPIGRADVTVTDGKMIADITFDRSDEFAAEVERKYRDGFLRAVSVGWNTLETGGEAGNEVTKADLLEISAVPVPGDPRALLDRTVTAMRSFIDEVDPGPEDNPEDDVIPAEDDEISEAMRLALSLSKLFAARAAIEELIDEALTDPVDTPEDSPTLGEPLEHITLEDLEAELHDIATRLRKHNEQENPSE